MGKNVAEHREIVLTSLAEIKSELNHIRSTGEKNEKWLSKLNGRVRKTENVISTIQGVGAIGVILFGGFITYIIRLI
jgi:hypothetical protein